MIETIIANDGGRDLHAMDFIAKGTLEGLGEALNDHGIAMDRILSLTCRPCEEDEHDDLAALYRVVFQA